MGHISLNIYWLSYKTLDPEYNHVGKIPARDVQDAIKYVNERSPLNHYEPLRLYADQKMEQLLHTWMTLDEGITHASDLELTNSFDRVDAGWNRQVKTWLTELQELRRKYAEIS